MTTSVPELAPFGERKPAVLLFADLTGYTELCRRLDPEDVAATVRPLMASLRRAGEEYGGTVCTQAGDGFMAVYGVPVASEDAAVRALQSAARMQEVVREANTRTGRQLVPGVHIGLAAGEVLVVPSDEPTGFSLIGTTVNLAARLCDVAAPGEILADDRCHELSGDPGLWRSADMFSLRGHDHPVRAWQLKSAPRETEGPLPGVPFLNRDRELRFLDAALEDVLSLRIARVVRVSGDAGIGKTALIRAWLDRHESVRQVTFRCRPTPATGYLQDFLARVTAALEDSDLGDTSSLRVGDPATTVAPRPDPFPALLAALRRLLERVATSGLVVVIEDIHQADPALLATIDDLEVRPVHSRLLLLATLRSEDQTTGADIVLDRLDDGHSQRLLEHALGAPAPDDLNDAVLTRAAGHPLMTIQSAAYLIESGTVAVADGTCRVVSQEAMEVLPTSLRMFVSARLDRLPSDEKLLVQQLSACGEDIDETAIRSLPHPPTPATLGSLVRRRLLSEPHPGHWRFAHGLVRDVAYASLPRRARRSLHQQQMDGRDPASEHGLRAYHAKAWAESTSLEDADDRRTATVVALEESLGHARQLFRTHAESAFAVVAGLDRLAEDAEDLAPDAVASLAALGAECLMEMWQFEAAIQRASTAVRLCRTHGVAPSLLVQALCTQAWALSRARHFQAARQAADEAYSVAESVGDLVGRAKALLATGTTWRYESFVQFNAHAQDAYDLLVQAGDRLAAGECARFIAYLLSFATPSVADRWLQTAIAHTADDDTRSQAWIARAKAMSAIVRLDLSEAKAAATRAVELGKLVGALDIVGDGLSVAIETAAGFGNTATLDSALAELDELAESTDNQRLKVVAGACSSLALLRAGRSKESFRRAEEAATISQTFGSSEQMDAAAGAAAACRDRGAWRQASEALERAYAAAMQTPFDTYVLNLRAQQARLLVCSGQVRTSDAVLALRDEAAAMGAPLVASYLDVIASHARLLAGDRHELSPAPADASPEELAMRADNRALLTQLDAGDTTAAWRAAVEAWQRLGYTIWLARAQARAGDHEAAEHTLSMIDADSDARAWALGPAQA